MRPALRSLSGVVWVIVLVGLLAPPLAGAESPSPTPAAKRTPVYAYFYQWFDRGSWQRAKNDIPLAGPYSSDDPHVLRDQVSEARSAGIDGFLTSWKDTPTLDRRLSLLLAVAKTERLDVGVVYEALDFQRKPLPIATVRADMTYLVTRWKNQLNSTFFGRPVIIWTGTDQYSAADVQSVRSALAGRALLLAASKDVTSYQRIAAYVDGEAYYWSSAAPQSAATTRKMTAFSDAVHAHGQIWIAPAAPGFDGRSLGHTRVISREGGQTFSSSLDNAFASKPDAVGVISWNEWSENTYIEPGRRYGPQDLNVLREYLAKVRGTTLDPAAPAPARRNHSHWTGLRAAGVLIVASCLGVCILMIRGGRTRKPGETTLDPDDASMSSRLPQRPPAGASR